MEFSGEPPDPFTRRVDGLLTNLEYFQEEKKSLLLLPGR